MNESRGEVLPRRREIRRRVHSFARPAANELLKIAVVTVALTVAAMWLQDLIRYLL